MKLVLACVETSSAVLQELDESNRFVQKSAESTLIDFDLTEIEILKFGGDPPNQWLISTQVLALLAAASASAKTPIAMYGASW